MEHVNDSREAARFVAVALALSILLGNALAAAGDAWKTPIGMALMVVPSVGALAARARLDGLGWRLPPGWTALAVVYPVAVFAAGGFGYLAVRGRLVPAEPPDPVRFLGSVALSFAVLVPLALGEEIGWRGLLQTRCERLLGPRRGIAAVAAVWAVWHLPFSLQGYYQPDHPYVGSFLLAVSQVGIGVVFGRLHRATRSVLVVALAHASLNSLTKFPFRLVEIRPEDELPMFVAVAALLAAAGAWALRRPIGGPRS